MKGERYESNSEATARCRNRIVGIAQLYKQQYRSDLSDNEAFKLAILANPELGELYIGHPVRDGLAEVKKFLLRE